MKRTLSVLLILVMMLGIVPAATVSASEVHVHGEEHDVSEHVHTVTAETFSSAHLTEVPEGYIPIYDEIDLYYVRNDMTANYIMMADIDLTEALAEGGSLYNAAGWIALGYDAGGNNIDYTGIFDGNGYSISGLEGNSKSAGLFVTNSGIIKNLTIASGRLVETNWTGTPMGSLAHSNYGIIDHCSNHASISARGTGNGGYMGYAGGIVGGNYDTGIIRNAVNYGEVKLTCWTGHSSSSGFVGGIAGFNYGLIEQSANHGKVGMQGGFGYDGSQSRIGAGGIAGNLSRRATNSPDATIRNSYNTGNVWAEAGYYTNKKGSNCGGIVGNYSGTFITDCYNIGVITPSNASYDSYGGIIGESQISGNLPSVTNCYYLNNIDKGVGNNTTNSCVSLSDALMQRQQSFVGFDFDTIWMMGTGDYLFPIIGHTHTLTHHETSEPTCTEDGNIEYWVCEKCGGFFTDEEGNFSIDPENVVLVALGHHFVRDPGQQPTCTEPGRSSGYYCSRCGLIDDGCVTLDPLGHDWGEWTAVTAPDCTGEGTEQHVCSRCGETETRPVDPLGHDWGEWILTTDPTCTETGVETETCSRCGATETRPVDPLGHDWGEWVLTFEPTCTGEGAETSTCARCGATEDRPVDPLGHDYVHHDAKAPTCTAHGWEAYDTCTRCSYTSYVDIPALGHNFKDVVTEPTCTEQGYTTHTCTRCGKKVIDTFVDPLGHVPVEDPGEEPTCTEPGHEPGTYCSRCGQTVSGCEEIPALGHDCNDVVTEPTCTERGYTTHTCTRCGNVTVDTYVDPLGHAWGDWVEVTSPTCTDTGSEKKTCARCGEIKERTIPALGHSYKDVVTEPTCTERGYTTHTCSVCGDSIVDSYVEALGHDWSDWETLAEPTCTEAGSEGKTCARCGEVEEKAIAALGHDLVHHDAKAPTCTEIGWDAYDTCSRCDHTTYVEIPALGHDYQAVTVEPTCTEPGYTGRLCSRCGDLIVETESDPLGHDFGEWVVTTEANCSQKQIETRYCSRCDATETREGELGDHIYKTTVTEPTCLKAGFTSYRCEICGHSYKANETMPLGHNWDNGMVIKPATEKSKGKTLYTCTRCGETEEREVPRITRDLVDSSKIFDDVKSNSWFRGAVDYVVTYELMNGTSATLFEPNSNMTRAMLVTVLWRYEGSPTGFKNNFNDVPAGKWYTDAVAWAGENDIVTGVAEGKFDPNGNITREQLATIFHRYTMYIDSEDELSATFSGFADGDKVSKWAVEGMQWAVAHGIIAGMSGEGGKLYLNPKGNATRAQVATVLMRYCSNEQFIHEWGEGKRTLDPTCTKKGEIKYVCSDCGAVKSVVISALGHKYGSGVVTKEATCTTAGTKTYTCTRCGNKKTESIKALGHKYGDAKVKDATCTASGTKTYTCSRCGHQHVDTIPAKGHKWKDATCTAPKTCSRCGTKSGSALGHKYGEGKVTKEPTCTAEGEKTYTCTRCGHKHVDKISAKGHKYDSGKVTKNPTCMDTGVKTYTCTRCGHKKTESIPKSGHKLNSKGICTICGSVKIEDVGPYYLWTKSGGSIEKMVTISSVTSKTQLRSNGTVTAYLHIKGTLVSDWTFSDITFKRTIKFLCKIIQRDVASDNFLETVEQEIVETPKITPADDFEVDVVINGLEPGGKYNVEFEFSRYFS